MNFNGLSNCLYPDRIYHCEMFALRVARSAARRRGTVVSMLLVFMNTQLGHSGNTQDPVSIVFTLVKAKVIYIQKVTNEQSL